MAAQAREAGIRLVLCSGRPAFGIALEYARQLDPDGWHVFQNGASIVHLGSGESLSTSLPSGATTALVAHARRTGHLLELYSDRDYVTESTSEWAREHADLLGVPFEPRSFDSLDGIVRAQWLASTEDAAALIAAAPGGLEIAQSSSPLMPATQFVGLTRAGVSKGTAVRSVAERLGIAIRDAMYVGDAGNDLAALRIVGWPVAMANADPAVLAAAKHVAGHVDAGGLADAFEIALRSAERGCNGANA
jgi:Cof subfamily protein (haloacid dehalogenase superfamily)